MPTPAAVLALVERFRTHLDAYKSGAYNETQSRREFLDPLFTELGWDVDNKAGYAAAYKDVVHEDAIRVGAAVKAPDYCFRIGGTRKFFLEAKKPSVNIKDEPAPAFQLRRYAWSAHLPLSILSDFEEFAVYDCRVRPSKDDGAAAARVFYCRYDAYAEKWDWIAEHFSREAILKGAFDKFADSAKAKRGTTEVDDDFLATIEGWRAELARVIALRNPQLSQSELNFAVQRTIDRVVFLRICEDRGAEPYGQLLAAVDDKAAPPYDTLRRLFHDADAKYNSGLFHFKAEKGQAEPPDTFTLSLQIDEKPLRAILKSLYYPDCPYEFSVLSADILGQVYERLLGKVIRLTDGHRAVVEEKPEVRKAGGVYYTPTYIVEHIIDQTLGQLLKDATLESAARLRVLDPACGSGAFLITAYQRLLDWHLDHYAAAKPDRLAAKPHPPIARAAGGGWKLTVRERKRILSNSIFGVDIDPQAVEVTKLSLLLKVLEDENTSTLQPELDFKERVLPNLAANIRCGNSLVGPDILDQPGLPDLTPDDHLRINPFDWKAEFKSILDGGGFDAVVGNPPYVRVQLLAHHELDYLFKSYSCAASKIDLSVFFLERSLQIASPKGLIGFIATKQWMTTDYGLGIRSILAAGHLRLLLDFGSLPVFKDADTYPAVIVCSKSLAPSFSHGKVINKEQLNAEGLRGINLYEVSFDKLGHEPWNLGGFHLPRMCASRKIPLSPLSNFGHVYIGALTGMDDAFVLSANDIGKNILNSSYVFPYAFRGNEVRRFSETNPSWFVIYPYNESEDGCPVLATEKELNAHSPWILTHLTQHKTTLRQRLDSRKLYATVEWYRHLRPGSFRYVRPDKLIFKGIDTRLSVGILKGNTVFNGANTPAFIPIESLMLSIKYLMGLLNSQLLGYHLSMICPPKLGGYFRFNATNINNVPIRTIDFANTKDKAQHTRMVSLVEQMLDLQRRKESAQVPSEATALERQIAAVDAAIDRLVYELYGLTEEEIKIVEAKA